MSEHSEQPVKKNESAMMYDKSHGVYGASMEMQAARVQAVKVADNADWCKAPQDIRDAAANEDRGNRPHVRDTSCDKSKGRSH